MKKLTLLALLIVLTIVGCIKKELFLYTINIKLIDGSWKTVKIEADKTPYFTIGCFSYDCGISSLNGYFYGAEKALSQPPCI